MRAIASSQSGPARGAEPYDLVGLRPLMELSEGRPEVAVGLIDGPVATDHPDFAPAIRVLPSSTAAQCITGGGACLHGTLVAGVLHARRTARSPGVAPGCTLLVRPIFSDTAATAPVAGAGDLAHAMGECIEAGARVVNLSLAVDGASAGEAAALRQAFDAAAHRGVIVVVAAGNQGAVGTTVLTHHPWVLPVAACDASGRILPGANIARGIGRRGLLAPGESIPSLKPGGVAVFGGTSAAAPFVAGAAALLFSLHPRVRGEQVRGALLASASGRMRNSLIPPRMDAFAAYRMLAGL